MGIFGKILFISCSVGTIFADTLHEELFGRELNELLYGNVTRFWEYASIVEDKRTDVHVQCLHTIEPNINLGASGHALETFQVLDNEFLNYTRRQHNDPIINVKNLSDPNGIWNPWYTYNRATHWENKGQRRGMLGVGVINNKQNVGMKDPEDARDYEELKKSHLFSAGLEFLIHARFQVYTALGKRQPYRNDNRYRIGYLYHRARRILYDIARIMNVAFRQNIEDEYFIDLNALLRLYERTMRLDLDMRDTIRMIYRIHEEIQAEEPVE